MAQLTITPVAAKRLAESRGHSGDLLAFKIDNGCRGGTALLLIQAKYLGSSDVHIGEVAVVGVYVERSLVRSYASDHYHFYVREGARDSGFSMKILHGFKFLMEREVAGPPPACPA